jgi:hypothetical protein
MNFNKYLKSCNRNEFTWQHRTLVKAEGGKVLNVAVEILYFEGREAILINETKGEYEATIELRHYPFVTTIVRKSRNSARRLAEKLIRKDIKKSQTLGVCDLTLL